MKICSNNYPQIQINKSKMQWTLNIVRQIRDYWSTTGAKRAQVVNQLIIIMHNYNEAIVKHDMEL